MRRSQDKTKVEDMDYVNGNPVAKLLEFIMERWPKCSSSDIEDLLKRTLKLIRRIQEDDINAKEYEVKHGITIEELFISRNF